MVRSVALLKRLVITDLKVEVGRLAKKGEVTAACEGALASLGLLHPTPDMLAYKASAAPVATRAGADQLGPAGPKHASVLSMQSRTWC